MAAFETSRPAQGLFAGRLSTLVSAVIDSVTAWNDARVTRAALSKLSDRELADIGVTRADIETISARA